MQSSELHRPETWPRFETVNLPILSTRDECQRLVAIANLYQRDFVVLLREFIALNNRRRLVQQPARKKSLELASVDV